ncbi:hypothetical protein KKB69_02185 [Patescibacteria group bacterium]|nr:hypothetical protein [Patescibacteria group bacterium]
MAVKKYIFVTAEGITYQPDSESDMPDIENLQVVGFGRGDFPEDAARNMLNESEYLKETNFNEIIGIELKSDKRTWHYLKDFGKRRN